MHKCAGSHPVWLLRFSTSSLFTTRRRTLSKVLSPKPETLGCVLERPFDFNKLNEALSLVASLPHPLLELYVQIPGGSRQTVNKGLSGKCTMFLRCTFARTAISVCIRTCFPPAWNGLRYTRGLLSIGSVDMLILDWELEAFIAVSRISIGD